MAQFGYAALPANIFRSVALSFFGGPAIKHGAAEYSTAVPRRPQKESGPRSGGEESEAAGVVMCLGQKGTPS